MNEDRDTEDEMIDILDEEYGEGAGGGSAGGGGAGGENDGGGEEATATTKFFKAKKDLNKKAAPFWEKKRKYHIKHTKLQLAVNRFMKASKVTMRDEEYKEAHEKYQKTLYF